MYNPISILHSLTRWLTDTTEQPDVVILTLGTNHVYRLKRTGEIVDNCKKQPQNWFQEEELSVADCAKALEEAIQQVKNRNANAKIVLTVSPIRYQKYGFHGSQLSKATLLLATHELVKALISAEKDVQYIEIESSHGHDAFLMEDEPYLKAVRAYIDNIHKELAHESA